MLGGVAHLTSNGFMPNGFSAVITALLGVMFAYMGAEIVTVAAAETKIQPKKFVRHQTQLFGGSYYSTLVQCSLLFA